MGCKRHPLESYLPEKTSISVDDLPGRISERRTGSRRICCADIWSATG